MIIDEHSMMVLSDEHMALLCYHYTCDDDGDLQCFTALLLLRTCQ